MNKFHAQALEILEHYFPKKDVRLADRDVFLDNVYYGKIVFWGKDELKIEAVETRKVEKVFSKLEDIKKTEIVEYCLKYHDYMWAAKILGILLECDFRDSKHHAEKYLLENQKLMKGNLNGHTIRGN